MTDLYTRLRELAKRARAEGRTIEAALIDECATWRILDGFEYDLAKAREAAPDLLPLVRGNVARARRGLDEARARTDAELAKASKV